MGIIPTLIANLGYPPIDIIRKGLFSGAGMHRARSSTRDDSDRVKDALSKIKSENRKLRKENSRLRKELAKYQHLELDLQTELDEEETFKQAPIEPKENRHPTKCSRCKDDDITLIQAGRYIIHLCNSCGFKHRKDAVGKSA